MTFKQRLKIAKRKLKEKMDRGEPIILMRPWSKDSLKALIKALSGGV
ncbi:MAG: hypothetical protein RL621_1612 [Bacteroidota bacterium]|jgi:hypothetical protein